MTKKMKLLKSLRHWEENVNRSRSLDGPRSYSTQCALCNYVSEDIKCGRCVVTCYTGKYGCVGSPYHEYREWRCKQNARMEYDFLLNLYYAEGYTGEPWEMYV